MPETTQYTKLNRVIKSVNFKNIFLYSFYSAVQKKCYKYDFQQQQNPVNLDIVKESIHLLSFVFFSDHLLKDS